MAKRLQGAATQTGRSHIAALTVLKQSEWFRDLTEDQLRTIAELSVPRSYKASEVIFHRDQPGDHLYGIVSGQVRVSTESEDGRELALNIVGAGAIGGEIAFLDGGGRTATWTAADDTVAFAIPRSGFVELLARESEIALHMIALLCERVRWTSQQVEEAAFFNLEQRLARRLTYLAGGVRAHVSSTSTGQPGDEPVTVRIAQAELASFLNASRQVVNGHLQAWQKAGFVKLGRGAVTILDLSKVTASS